MATQRSSPLLAFLIITAGFVLGYVYESQLDTSADILPLNPQYQVSSLKGLEHLSINYSFVTSDAFTSLKVFGELPVVPGTGGNHNPFQ